ncbi:hypothetical protein TrST_g12374 [Triparma strigata]|uniref:Uncharacterized protein n=1 Tax=Triparma strigata TaxID=1606541 RepID=A0A9W7E5E4_9STRA|nr:hypothetical protein TrST_g12374 [Triparma strigata]
MSQGKTLRDLNRVTFEFEDPLLMALCFEVLNKKYNIHGLKNKYLQETFKEPPNLHMNLDIRDGWLCEVQMLFWDILLIKKELHKFYDVNRADGPFVVAGKLFKDRSDEQEDENLKYSEEGENSDTSLMETNQVLLARIRELERQLREEQQQKAPDVPDLPKVPNVPVAQPPVVQSQAKPLRKLKKSRK